MKSFIFVSLIISITSAVSAQAHLREFCDETATRSRFFQEYKNYAWQESDPVAKERSLERAKIEAIYTLILDNASYPSQEGQIVYEFNKIESFFDPDIEKSVGRKREIIKAQKRAWLNDKLLTNFTELTKWFQASADKKLGDSKYNAESLLTFEKKVSSNVTADGNGIEMRTSIKVHDIHSPKANEPLSGTFNIHVVQRDSQMQIEICPESDKSKEICGLHIVKFSCPKKGEENRQNESCGFSDREGHTDIVYVGPQKTFDQFISSPEMIARVKSEDPSLYKCLQDYPDELRSDLGIKKHVLANSNEGNPDSLTRRLMESRMTLGPPVR